MRMEDFDDIVPEIDYFNHRFSTPNWIIEDSFIDFTDLTYVVDGRARYVIDGQPYLVSAGDLLCIPLGSRRSATTFENALVESYSINARLLSMRAGHEGERVTLPFPLIYHIGHRSEVLALLHELKSVWLLRNAGYRLQVRALCLNILQHYIQLVLFQNDVHVTDLRIKRVLRYVIDHYNETLTTQAMADMTGLSAMYFGNLFKQETGLCFKQYLSSIRLNHAEDMLSSGEFSVNEVATACGFSDIFYFSKVFKRYRGVPPSKITRFGQGHPMADE